MRNKILYFFESARKLDETRAKEEFMVRAVSTWKYGYHRGLRLGSLQDCLIYDLISDRARLRMKRDI